MLYFNISHCIQGATGEKEAKRFSLERVSPCRYL